MLTLENVVPCSICGCKPVLSCSLESGSGRLKCPNYKSKEIIHGALGADRNGITMGFTNRCYLFYNEKQAETQGIPIIVREWNYIHKNGITNKEFDKLIF